MELVKSPYTGLQCYQFKVSCQCRCHKPGYVYDWPFSPCCQCDANKQNTVELYPLELIERPDIRQRMNMNNHSVIARHPEILEQIKI